MCLMLYLGADRELPTTEPWNREKPRFHVVRPTDCLDAIRKHLQTEYVYYLGAHEGCGCGFHYESSKKHDELLKSAIPEEQKALETEDRLVGMTSVQSLREYLVNVTAQGPVKLLVTWDGCEDHDIEHMATIQPSYFGGDEFWLKENTLFEVVA